MSDDADRAGEAIDQENERLVETALRTAQIKTIGARVRCANCGDDLAQHRREYGLCIECARAVELKRKGYGQ